MWFACPSCSRLLQAEAGQIGQAGTCPGCGTTYQVPAGERPTTADIASPSPTVAYEPVPERSSGAPTTGAPVEVPGYDVLGELGRGGMGVIYKARQFQPPRLVALKMILAGEHAGAEALARFRSEAGAFARLVHPNIVQIHEVGEHNGRPYLTLEYVEGGNLAQKLADGPLPPREAAGLLAQLADAVQFAHAKGVVHRDLKPANVLLAASGGGGGPAAVPKIADFGLAKQLEGVLSVAVGGPLTQSGAILGTPSYMAPEQAGGKRGQVGPAADVHALGAVLYECLTGRPPFRAETMIDTLMQVVAEEPVPPGRLRRDCPRDLETICLKCLEKDPHRRYATAGALAEDLRRWLDDEPITGRPPGRVERLGRSLRRRKELAYLAAGVLATCALGLLISTLARFAPSSPAPERVEEKPDRPAELPPDLDLMPRDAFAFATVRVADLWARRTVRDLADLAGPTLGFNARAAERFATELQRESGVGPDDIERATVVVADGHLTTRAVVLGLAKPCDPERVRRALEKLTGPLQPQPVEGKTVYADANRRGYAFCPFSDRVLLLGDPLSVSTLLEKNARRPAEGRLNDALHSAARPHALVVGLRPSQEFFETFEQVNEGLARNKLESLRQLDTAQLVVDLPDTPSEAPLDGLALDLTLSFPDEAQARPGLTETLAFLRHLVTALESDKAPQEIRPLLAGLLDSLRSANWRQEGSRIRLALQLHWKPDVLTGIHRIVHRKMDGAVAAAQSLNDLKQIALAMHHYREEHGRFPPAVVYKDDRPLYSWRVLLLPYLERQNLYKQFHLDEPWDSEHNRKLLAVPGVYAGPWGDKAKADGGTYYQVLVGPGAAFEGRQGVRTEDFADGTATTLLVVEAADAVPWTSPRDLASQPGKPLPAFGGHLPGVFHAAFADGYVGRVPADTSEKTLRALITRNGGERVTRP